MPIYEYKCKNCGHILEEIQGFNDEPLHNCPECQQPELAKLLSAPAFHLKGSGWYATDFKNPAKKSESAKPVAAATDEKPKATDTAATPTADAKTSDSKSKT